MPVFPDSSHEKVDSAGSLDFGFIICTLGSEVRSVSVEDVYVLLRNIYMVEEVPCHE